MKYSHINLTENDKLYIVVREDLKPGYQLSQSVHAALGFMKDFPEETISWMDISNHIVICNSPTETTLLLLIERGKLYSLKMYIFKEFDLDNQVTAVAFEPGINAMKVCSGLKLALRDVK